MKFFIIYLLFPISLLGHEINQKSPFTFTFSLRTIDYIKRSSAIYEAFLANTNTMAFGTKCDSVYGTLTNNYLPIYLDFIGVISPLATNQLFFLLEKNKPKYLPIGNMVEIVEILNSINQKTPLNMKIILQNIIFEGFRLCVLLDVFNFHKQLDGYINYNENSVNSANATKILDKLFYECYTHPFETQANHCLQFVTDSKEKLEHDPIWEKLYKTLLSVDIELPCFCYFSDHVYTFIEVNDSIGICLDQGKHLNQFLIDFKDFFMEFKNQFNDLQNGKAAAVHWFNTIFHRIRKLAKEEYLKIFQLINQEEYSKLSKNIQGIYCCANLYTYFQYNLEKDIQAIPLELKKQLLQLTFSHTRVHLVPMRIMHLFKKLFPMSFIIKTKNSKKLDPFIILEESMNTLTGQTQFSHLSSAAIFSFCYYTHQSSLYTFLKKNLDSSMDKEKVEIEAVHINELTKIIEGPKKQIKKKKKKTNITSEQIAKKQDELKQFQKMITKLELDLQNIVLNNMKSKQEYDELMEKIEVLKETLIEAKQSMIEKKKMMDEFLAIHDEESLFYLPNKMKKDTN